MQPRRKSAWNLQISAENKTRERRLSLLKNPETGSPSWSAGILARKMLVERSGFCGLEVRAPTDFSTSSASSLQKNKLQS